jgi:hypothetical protein
MNQHLQAHIPKKLSNYLPFDEINKKPVNQINVINISKTNQLPKQHLFGSTNGLYDVQGVFHNDIKTYNNVIYFK